MLRTLFDSLESSLGPRVEGPAQVLWLLGVALVAWTLLTPLVRAALDGRLARSGLVLGWTKQCARCGARTLLRSEGCEKCGAGLPLPAGVRLLARLTAPGTPTRSAVLRWLPAGLGALAFGGALLVLATASHVLAPEGRLERLFAASALLAFTGLGVLLGRALSLKGLRLLDRLKSLVFAAAAATALVATLAIAEAARPEKTVPLAVLRAQEGAVVVGEKRLETDGDQVSIQYQLLELPSAGLVHLTPLAVVAKSRVALPHGRADDWLVSALWSQAPALQERGITVRRRTEQFHVAPGTTYRVVARAREVDLVPAPASP